MVAVCVWLIKMNKQRIKETVSQNFPPFHFPFPYLFTILLVRRVAVPILNVNHDAHPETTQFP
jgi:hypothetical protein